MIPREEVFTRLDTILLLIFPNDKRDVAANWQQSPYMDDLFDLACDAVGVVFAGEVEKYLDGPWEIERKQTASKELKREIARLAIAWGHWQFAFRKLILKE